LPATVVTRAIAGITDGHSTGARWTAIRHVITAGSVHRGPTWENLRFRQERAKVETMVSDLRAGTEVAHDL
jgi:hypothetical protein